MSLVVHTVALARILGTDAVGLRRTALCRVAGAVAYVSLAVTALAASAVVTALTALIVAGLVQAMWWCNAVADVRLRRRLDNRPHPRSV